MIASATISDDGLYRYDLVRSWDDGLSMAMWIMANPSTADATHDDPTIRRCEAFSRRWGHGAMVVVNLYAYRATHPKILRGVDDPVGVENMATIRRWLDDDRVLAVIAAWGAAGHEIRNGSGRARIVTAIASQHGHELLCLGVTKAGIPRHPLYVRGDTIPELYQP
jgi:hypothetical protein